MENFSVELRHQFKKNKFSSWSKWSDYIPVFLFKGDNSYTSSNLDEYTDEISIEIKSDVKMKVFEESGFGDSAKIENGNKYYYKHFVTLKNDGGEVGRGKAGVRRLEVNIQTNEASLYSLNINIPLDSANLTKEQFDLMLDDISHWVFFELASSVKKGIKYSDKISNSLYSQEAVLELIGQKVPIIEAIIKQISRSPKKKIVKRYYRTTKPFEKHDVNTLRLENQYADEMQSFTFQNEQSYNVYENRFVRFFLHQLKQRLVFLQDIIDKTIAETKREIRRETAKKKKYKKYRDELEKLDYKLVKAKKLLAKCSKIKNDISKLDKIDFLEDVDFSSSQFTIIYSLGLIQDFNYGRVFSLYRELALQEDIKHLDIVKGFKDGLFSLGIQNTSKIYEQWTFLALYKTLTDLHFSPKEGSGLLSLLKDDTLIPSLMRNKEVHFVDEENIYGGIDIFLFYDKPYFNKDRSEKARPDITMEILDRYNRKRFRFLFDAKYKTWDEGGNKKNNKNAFWQDYNKQLVGKYSPKRGRVSDVHGAFFFHTNTSDAWFKNYGSFIQDEENGKWRANNHNYGFIPVVPGSGEPVHLKTLLAMIFLFKMEITPKICWTCGSTNIDDRGKGVVCNDCGKDWKMTHCGICKNNSCHVPLYRNKNYTFQPLCEKCGGMTICPSCGKCFDCRLDIDTIKKRELLLKK